MSSPERTPASPAAPSSPPPAGRKPILNEGALITGILLLLVGLIILLIGNILANTIAVEYDIMFVSEYPIEPSRSPFGYYYYYEVPEYRAYIYHPYWVAGAVLLIIGFGIFIFGIAKLTLQGYEPYGESRPSPAYLAAHPKLRKRKLIRDLFFASILVLVIGLALLAVATAIKDVSVNERRVIDRWVDPQSGTSYDIYSVYPVYPFRDVSTILTITGIAALIMGTVELAIGTYLYARMEYKSSKNR